MPNDKHRVLAIDPGTRDLGYAYFEDTDLWDYGVKQIREKPGPREMLAAVEEILAHLIREKRPHALAMEKNRFSQIRQNARLTLVVSRIRAIARQHGIRVFEYDPRTVRKVVCRNGNTTKRELARTLAVRFPELKQYLHQDKKWKERYHQSSFDAVGCGLTYLALNHPFSRMLREHNGVMVSR